MSNKLKFSSFGSGSVLVFIHGWGVNSAVWQPIIEPLAKHYQVITIDLPGFGINSDVQLADYSLVNIAKLIVQSIGRPAVYIGWSLGGLVATEIALQMPNQALALCTVASSPCFMTQTDWPAIQPNVLKGFHQQLAENPALTIKNFLKIQAMGSPNVRHDIKVINDLVMQYPMAEKNILDKSLSLLETTDQRKNLKLIQQPFLRLYGRLDGLVPRQVIKKVDELALHSQSYIFQQASHAPFISQREEFSKGLQAWLLAQNLDVTG